MLSHSLGYECQRPFNLCVADENTLLFCSGRLLHIFDINSRHLTTKHFDFDCCLGFVVKNPVESHIAIGEKGPSPSIIIYNWPSFQIVKTLKNGTCQGYVFLAYSHDGKLLCAQGGAPDYSLSLWDWKMARILASTPSYNTLRVQFSSYIPNHIVSCGEEGISVWQLTSTVFSGSRLHQTRGHFNTLDQCEIRAALAMPDGQVVSGCAWGNILVWCNGRLMAEACQRNRQPCHDKPIIHFTYNDHIDELYSVGMDGWIKTWHYSRFKSDPFSDDLTVVIKPVFEIQVKDESGPSSLAFILKKNNNPADTTWFAQDCGGGIWQVDMRVSADVKPASRLYRCHAGPIVALSPFPRGSLIASLASRGDMHIYDLESGALLTLRHFPAQGTALMWLPIQKDSGEEDIVVGFQDGTIRIVRLSNDISCTIIIQESKPHSRAVTAISVNESASALVTGSQDCTVFIYNLLFSTQIIPIGFIQLTSPVSCICWKPHQEMTQDIDNIFLICCSDSLNEAYIPRQVSTGASYKLNVPICSAPVENLGNYIKDLLFVMYAGSNLYLASSRSVFEYDWENKQMLNEYEVGEKISSVYTLRDGSVWFVGMESGSLITLFRDPCGWLSRNQDWDVSLHDIEYGAISDICLSSDGRTLATCGRDGNLFIYQLYTNVPVAKLESIKVKPPEKSAEVEIEKEEDGVSLEEAKRESVAREKLAVAMMKKVRVQKQLGLLSTRYYRLLKSFTLKKYKTKIGVTMFISFITIRNESLPESQKLPHSEFLLDPRLKAHVKSIIDSEMKLVKQRIIFEYEKSHLGLEKIKRYFIDCLASFHIEITAIRGKATVATFVHRKFDEEFEKGEECIKMLVNKTQDNIVKVSTELLHKVPSDTSPPYTLEVTMEEPYLRAVHDIYHKLSIKTRRALDKHKLLKNKKEERKKQWQAFLETRPNQDKNLSEDVSAVDHAARTIGDYKLKSSKDYKLADQSKNTSTYKLSQLIQAKREIYNKKEAFNKKIHRLREKQVELVVRSRQMLNNLETLQQELSENCRITPPDPPQLNVAKVFPERQYQIYPEREPGKEPLMPQEYDEEFYILYGNVRSSANNSKNCEDNNCYDPDEEDTEWESQIRSLRTTRQLYKRDQILADMEKIVGEFDRQVSDLSGERLRLSIKLKYLESFVAVLQQELLITRRYDAPEAAILARVSASLADKHTRHLKMNILQHKLDSRVAELTVLNEMLLGLEKSLTELTAGSRVAKHLVRLFNKKIRPGDSDEGGTGSDEDSSSDETSSDSDWTAQVGRPSPRPSHIYRCPPECDKQIHKEIIELRGKKHKIEGKIMNEKQAIEQMTREKERGYKYLKLIEPVLRINQDQLDKLQKEKQQKLNETEVLVILNCSQICGQRLVMSRKELDKLRARVHELQRHTDQQLEKLRKSQRYQQRLNDDCSQIELKISQLKKDIDKAMICKFGQQVNVETLEEKILAQMIKKTRESLREEELHKKYQILLKDLKEELLEKQEDLADVIRENTHKLRMLSSLEEEKQKLIALSLRVKKAAALPNEKEHEYSDDVVNLTRLLHTLILQKETIIHEIKVLSLKGRPLPPIPPIIEGASATATGTATATALSSRDRDSDDLASNECQTARGGEEEKEQEEEGEEEDAEVDGEGEGGGEKDEDADGEVEREDSTSTSPQPKEDVF